MLTPFSLQRLYRQLVLTRLCQHSGLVFFPLVPASKHDRGVVTAPVRTLESAARQREHASAGVSVPERAEHHLPLPPAVQRPPTGGPCRLPTPFPRPAILPQPGSSGAAQLLWQQWRAEPGRRGGCVHEPQRGRLRRRRRLGPGQPGRTDGLCTRRATAAAAAAGGGSSSGSAAAAAITSAAAAPPAITSTRAATPQPPPAARGAGRRPASGRPHAGQGQDTRGVEA